MTLPSTVPVANGRIAFRRFLGPDRPTGDIFTINPDATGLHQVTTSPANGDRVELVSALCTSSRLPVLLVRTIDASGTASWLHVRPDCRRTSCRSDRRLIDAGDL